MSKAKSRMAAKEGSGNMVYCLGIIGSAVYFVQQANGFGEVLVGLLKALVWPAFLVYELLKSVAA